MFSKENQIEYNKLVSFIQKEYLNWVLCYMKRIQLYHIYDLIVILISNLFSFFRELLFSDILSNIWIILNE